MAHTSPLVGTPWLVDAEDLPDVEYECYRRLYIHETPPIVQFLEYRRGVPRIILVAPKGYGKTLLLRAKEKSIRQNKPDCRIIPDMIDRATGAFPITSNDYRRLLQLPYEVWKSLWRISIATAALNAYYLNHDGMNEILSTAHPSVHLRKILEAPRFYVSATSIFSSFVDQGREAIEDAQRNAKFLLPALQLIREQQAMFIDKVDRYFDAVLGAPGKSGLGSADIRDLTNKLWAVGCVAKHSYILLK
jgi:hypothetical protein